MGDVSKGMAKILYPAKKIYKKILIISTGHYLMLIFMWVIVLLDKETNSYYLFFSIRVV